MARSSALVRCLSSRELVLNQESILYFSVYHYSGSVESAGISNEQFIELLRVSPSEIEKRLFAKTDEQGWPGPDIDLFINRIQEAIACDPQIGFTLWGLVNRHEEGGTAMQYRCAIIRGWGMSSLKSSQEPVLDLMKDFLSHIKL